MSSSDSRKRETEQKFGMVEMKSRCLASLKSDIKRRPETVEETLKALAKTLSMSGVRGRPIV